MNATSLFPCFFFVLCLYHNPTFAQAPEIDWEHTYGGSRMDVIHHIIENIEGGIAAIGESKSKSNGGVDIYFLLVGKKGNVQSEKRLGHSKDDGGYAIIQTFDGGYALVGYTSPKGSSNTRNGIIIKTDEKGITLWYKSFGGSEDDVFEDLIQGNDGSLILLGNKGDAAWLLKLDAAGKEIWNQTFQYQNKKTKAKKFILNQHSEFVITGSVVEGESKQTLLMGVTQNGDPSWQHVYFTKTHSEAHSLILTSEGQYAITGTMKTQREREQMFYLLTDPLGKILKDTVYGGRGNDGSFAIMQTYHDDIVMGGYNASFERGARRNRYWIRSINESNNATAWEMTNGSKLDDGINDMIQLSDGSIVAAGFSTRAVKMEEGLILKFKTVGLPKTNTKIKINTEIQDFVHSGKFSFLEKNNRGYLAVKISNNSDEGVYAMKAKVECRDCVEGLITYDSINIGYIPKQSTKYIGVPVYTDNKVETGNNKLDISFSDKNDSGFEDLDYQISTKEEPKVELAFVSHNFETAGAPGRDNPITLTVDIENRGDLPANVYEIKFGIPYKVMEQSSLKQSIPLLQPGETKRLSFTFIIPEIYLGDEVIVSCRALEASVEGSTNQTFKLNIGDYKPSAPTNREDLLANLAAKTTKETAEVKQLEAEQDKRNKTRITQLQVETVNNIAVISEIQRDVNRIQSRLDALKKEELARQQAVEKARLEKEAEIARLEAVEEAKRVAEAEAEQKRKEEALQMAQEVEAKRIVAEEAHIKATKEAERIAKEEARKQAEAAVQKRLAEEIAAAKKLTEEQKRLAEEAEAKRIATKTALQAKLAEQKKVAEEAEAKRMEAEFQRQKELAKQKTNDKNLQDQLQQSQQTIQEMQTAMAEMQQKLTQLETAKVASKNQLSQDKTELTKERDEFESVKQQKEQALQQKQKDLDRLKAKLEEDQQNNEEQQAIQQRAAELGIQEEQLRNEKQKQQEENNFKEGLLNTKEAELIQRTTELETSEKNLLKQKTAFEQQSATIENNINKTQTALSQKENELIKKEREIKEERRKEEDLINRKKAAIENDRKKLEQEKRAFQQAQEAMKEQQEKGQNILASGWAYPFEMKFTTEVNHVHIRITSQSSQPLEKQHFKIIRNGEPLFQNAKFDEVSLEGSGDNNRYRYVFEHKRVPLLKGKNVITVLIKNEAGEEELPPIEIRFQPRKPNLHLISIGVEYGEGDLLFTKKDATDFADAFLNQQGEDALYEEISYKQILTRKENTTAIDIDVAFSKLSHFYTQQEINKNDVIIIFISSHGYVTEHGAFRLKPSDYNGMSPDKSSIDFELDILAKLEAIKCKRYVFIDACKSGSIEGLTRGVKAGPDEKELSKALAIITEARAAIRTMASCSAEEFSYEDPKWGNGAFTKALLEAFNGYESKGLKADTDGNKIIFMNELYSFVKKRVPEIVSSKQPKADTGQNPFMPRGQVRDVDLPVFVIQK